MTLEKYLSKVTVIEKPTGAQELVMTGKPSPKIACLWLIREPAPRIGCEHEKNGFCTYEKYCNQKGVWKWPL